MLIFGMQVAGRKGEALSWFSDLGWAYVRTGERMEARYALCEPLCFFPSPDPKPAEASDFRNKEEKEGRKVTAWWFRKGLCQQI